ncbi:ABC transporter ATP-binding protein [Streptomyces sp. HC44]|uniref:ABC transporter ATP-binding protein n=1 Tax=Streptomyces scabichelini TaxID=2711217 RepID=A0A6G4V689_9ACTN|nr:ABC transporter ATP-binding protein [Streptomyces scabichelini]NGO09435.1 ABC transporter ATP-binding protein [Streptomyces scabichelini]
MAQPDQLAAEATAEPSRAAVSLEDVTKRYGKGRAAVDALRGITLSLRPATFTAVMGPSGSGKSTFLRCAAGLENPSSGRVLLGDIDLAGLKEKQLTLLRRDRIGFIFQAFNLVASLTAERNIVLPLRLGRHRVDTDWLDEVVRRTGLENRLGHRPAEMSGGQQQRVAVARALVTRPEVVFADEPTGALDLTTAREVLRLLREVVDGLGQTLVMVTHDPLAASYADTVLFLADGRIVDQLHGPGIDPEQVAERLTRLEA